jgi:hypothetical protein
VFYIALPIAPSTIFSCHICPSTGQNLRSHNSLKKHFKNTHKCSVVVRFECRLCKLELPGVKSFAAHAAEFHPATSTFIPSLTEQDEPIAPQPGVTE